MSESFERTVEYVLNLNTVKHCSSIGLLGEKTLHSVIKYYIESDKTKHEIKIGTYYADIFDGRRIFEVQTRSFNLLRKKLDCFLKEYSVTVVYPIPYRKWIAWIDPETGERTNNRLSPKRGSEYDITKELYRIKMYLKNKNLSFRIILLDVEETRLKDGWGRNGKRGSHRIERIPVRLEREMEFGGEMGYKIFIPESLNGEFTSLDFAKAAGIKRSCAQTLLNILFEVGEVEKTGKKGNAIIYEIV